MFVIKEFQTTCLILLTDWAKDNVPYLLATLLFPFFFLGPGRHNAEISSTSEKRICLRLQTDSRWQTKATSRNIWASHGVWKLDERSYGQLCEKESELATAIWASVIFRAFSRQNGHLRAHRRTPRGRYRRVYWRRYNPASMDFIAVDDERRCVRQAEFPSNATNAADGTDATNDEASDRHFDTPSLRPITNIKLFAFFQ